MGKYIKLFENHTQYTAFTQTEEFVIPNVSHCIQENHVHYNPLLAVTCTFSVSDASVTTPICYYSNESGYSCLPSDNFTKVVVDGTVVTPSALDTAEGEYQLSVGEHTIVYYLTSETINEGTFLQCTEMTSATIGNGVSEIGAYGFVGCTNLTTLSIPSTMTAIGSETFAKTTGVPLPLTTLNIDTPTVHPWFSGFSTLQTVNLGSNVTAIDDGAFCACQSLDAASVQSISAINEDAICNVVCMTVTYPSNVEEAYLPSALGYAFTGGDDIDPSEIYNKQISL